MANSRLIDHAGLDEAEYDVLAAMVSGHYALDDVFAWGRAHAPAVHPPTSSSTMNSLTTCWLRCRAAAGSCAASVARQDRLGK